MASDEGLVVRAKEVSASGVPPPRACIRPAIGLFEPSPPRVSVALSQLPLCRVNEVCRWPLQPLRDRHGERHPHREARRAQAGELARPASELTRELGPSEFAIVPTLVKRLVQTRDVTAGSRVEMPAQPPVRASSGERCTRCRQGTGNEVFGIAVEPAEHEKRVLT